MRYLLPILVLLFSSCYMSKVAQQSPEKNYPEDLSAIFKQHGGLEQWQSMQALSYTLVDTDGTEKHKQDLWNRRERIEGSNFTMGFDGKDIWLDAKADYTGNPKFMYNLYFYFFAMPFVLADDGIIYSDTPALEYEGKAYPGIKISYEDGIGLSPKDEYFVHYDPETKQMKWLGYTVTYFSKKKSDNIKWIRYDQWKQVKKVNLPTSLTWFKVEDGKLIAPRKTIQFKDIQLSKKAHQTGVFQATSGATIVE